MTTFSRIGLSIGAAVLAVGLAGVYTSAQDGNDQQRPFAGRRGGPGGPGRFGGPGGPGGPLGLLGPAVAERLNLTDAQKEQIQTIARAHRAELQPLGERAMETRQALHNAITADTLDEGLIRARATELGAAEADMAVARARVHAEVFKILTPDQQAQARELQARMQQRMKERGERREQRGGPQR